MRTLSPGDSISGDLKRIVSEEMVGEGARLYRSLQQGAGNLCIKRLLLIKENQISHIRDLALLCMGRCKYPDLLK